MNNVIELELRNIVFLKPYPVLILLAYYIFDEEHLFTENSSAYLLVHYSNPVIGKKKML